VVNSAAHALLALVAAQSWSPQAGGAAAPSASATATGQTGEQYMPTNDKQDQAVSKTPAPHVTPQTDMVITPAGPVPKDKVYEVKSGEAVRQKNNGTITIVPNSEAK